MESAEEDVELRELRATVEKLRSKRDLLAKQIYEREKTVNPKHLKISELDKAIANEKVILNIETDRQLSIWKLKMVALRLGFALPFLLIGFVLWFRRNRIKYITLFWGYEAAVLWLILFAIGPYLPYYGGYIPLILAAALTVFLVVSLVRYLNRRTALRRRWLIDKFLLQHCCPACERNYLIGMENMLDIGDGRIQGKSRNKNLYHFDKRSLSPKQCPNCGYVLFAECVSCHSLQPAHLDYCATGCVQKSRA